MHYYEVLIADGSYHASAPLTYSYEGVLPDLSVVSVPLRNKLVTGFIGSEVPPPPFKVKAIRSLLSAERLPFHCIQLAEWLSEYYSSKIGESLRLFAPSQPAIKRPAGNSMNKGIAISLDVDSPLTPEQEMAVETISTHPSTSVLLHGETGSGKTRVYLELAARTLGNGKSVILLTPEIALISQLKKVVSDKLSVPTFIIHSDLTVAERKKLWLQILESKEPSIVIGPRSALFTPVNNPGLIVLDEAHEPAYKQEQSPRYHAIRVASQLGALSSARVVLGSATPSIQDYFLAEQKNAVVRMNTQAKTRKAASAEVTLLDIRNRNLFSKDNYLSNPLIDDISTTLSQHKQALLFYNRRGTARLILCEKCGWQGLCPNCDIPLTYHGDQHLARCHICNFKDRPPLNCPNCNNPDIIYRSIGTKTLTDIVRRLFPKAIVRRYDSDNLSGEKLEETYQEVRSGRVDILIGTQVLAKGLDLPRLGLVGVVSAETSLSLPDYTAEERTFQLLYQVMGRVGRGHTAGKVIVQTYSPEGLVVRSAAKRDYLDFYKYALNERRKFRFPPYSYLLKLECRRATEKGAVNAAEKLKGEIIDLGLNVEVIGPSPSFYPRRGKYYYYQLVIKSKNRGDLVKLADYAPAGWSVDLDPVDLL